MTKLRKADKRARQWDKNWMTKLYNGGGRASARHERRESSTVGRGRLPGSMTVVLRHDLPAHETRSIHVMSIRFVGRSFSGQSTS